jgi:Uma2 family endonuclease
MIATLRPLTYDDLVDMPDDGQRYEIIGGELLVNPAPTWNHQRVVEPDLVFVASEQGPVAGGGHSFQGAPHLLVEVVSPSSRQSDNVKKLALYARAGVLEYWIADPVLRTLVINVLEAGMYLPIQADPDGWLSSRALRGLRVNPSDLFAGLD